MKHLLRALALVAALIVGSQAQATILAACTEDTNCLLFNTFVDSSNSFFDSTFSRLALEPQGGNNNTNYVLSAFIKTNSFSASSFWMTGTWVNFFGYNTNGFNFLEFLSADGVPRIIFQTTAPSPYFQVLKRTAGGAVTTLVSSCGPLTGNKLDIHIIDNVAGSITVYANGQQICSFSGDTTTDGVSTIASVELSNMASNGSSSGTAWSQILVADVDTRNLHLMTCAPLAAGNTQLWTGSASNVNPTSYNDQNFNYDGTANQLSQWAISCPSTIQPSWGIVDVQQFARVSVGSSGPQHFRFSAHVNGADYDNGADIAGLISFQNYSYDWGANSPSGGAWTPAELNTGFSSGIESTP